MRNAKKSLLTSIISLVLCFCMLLGSTWAWFTDSVGSDNNKIQAGNLSIDLELLDKKTGKWNSLKNSRAPIFNYDRWEPGYVDTKILKVENEGTLALKWCASFYSENQLSILADVIDVYVCPSENELAYPVDRSLEGYTCVGNLRSFIETLEETTHGVLEAGACAYLGIALKMRESAGNEYKKLSLGGTFDIRILATQYAFESDSFDETYDELTREDVMVSRTKMLAEGERAIDFPLFYMGKKLIDVSVPASAIADPTKPVSVSIDAIDPTITVVDSTQTYSYDIEVSNLRDNITAEEDMVTVAIVMPTALAAMQAYHNGELIEDAVYDDVSGTVTFKTASFSPYDFTTNVEAVSTLEELRAVLQKDGYTAKLASNIEVDLTKQTGAARHEAHKVSSYYNGIVISGKDVGLDLNGYQIIAKCGNQHDSNSDVGALFFIGANGSLNVNDTAEGGCIRMEGSMYTFWAPYDDPSYLRIYGGAFIADSYAGDTIGTPVDGNGAYDPENGNMKNENSNRSIVYAGFGGHVDVYGGYFLYNNTPNDTLNRNNGAFNAQNWYEEERPLLVIHEGVYMSNSEYRQNPKNTSTPHGSFDNYSVKLEGEGAEIYETDDDLLVVNPITLDTPVMIDGKEYADWYQVQRTYYELTFMSNDGTKQLASVKIPFTQGEVDVAQEYAKAGGAAVDDFSHWVNTGADKITTIPEGNTKHVTLYAALESKFTARYLDESGNVLTTVTFTAKSNLSVIKNAAPENPASSSQYLAFDHWEVRNSDGSTTELDEYKPSSAKGDITIYPYYNVKQGSGMIGLRGRDTDGDGVIDEYTVEAVTGLSGKIEIPGYVNGVPVKVITDLSGDSVNSAITSIIIKDGVETINSEAFAMTSNLKEVTVPASVTSVGSNVFASGLGGGFTDLIGAGKVVTITYAGTWDQWLSICESGWDSGIAKNSKVICKGDGSTYVKTGRAWNTGANQWEKQ